MESSKVIMMDLSSAYCEVGDRGAGAPGKERPVIRGLARMLTANASETRTYSNGDRGHPWRTPRDNEKKGDK